MLNNRRYNSFTDNEIKQLQQLYPEHTREQLKESFPERNYHFLRYQAKKLGLKKSQAFRAEQLNRAREVHHAKQRANPSPAMVWRKLSKQVKKRDNYLCQDCGQPEWLVVHHIDADKENNELDNLITLCPSCHIQRHYDGAGAYLTSARFEYFLSNEFSHLKIRVSIVFWVTLTILGAIIAKWVMG